MKFVCNAQKVMLFHCKSRAFVFFRILRAPKTHENVIVTVSTTYVFSAFFQKNKNPFKNIIKHWYFFENHVKVGFSCSKNKNSDALTYRFPHFFPHVFSLFQFLKFRYFALTESSQIIKHTRFSSKNSTKKWEGWSALREGPPSGLTAWKQHTSRAGL